MLHMLMYFIICLMTGLLALRVGALNRNGAVAAVFVGTAIAFGFGWKGLILLGTFFVSSSVWSKYKHTRKQRMEQIVAKGSARDHFQVLANGGAAAFAGIMMGAFPSSWWLAFFIASLAASNADTWASEVGVLSRKDPFHILKLRVVPRGTSGAVSILGFLASIVAALLIAGVGSILYGFSPLLLIVTTCAGVLGCLIDTIIGATIQEEFYCRKCALKTEHHEHCGRETIQSKGLRGINNDVVNMVSSICGGIAGGIWFL